MIDLIIIAIFTVIFVVLLFRFLHGLRAESGKHEPIIELEKLVNCTSCGSLVPEGVGKCAFCGAIQRKPT